MLHYALVFFIIALVAALFGFGGRLMGWSDPNGQVQLGLFMSFIFGIVCGYRTPWSNNLLRSRSANSGVAQHSQHMLAKAIDIRVPGVSTVDLRDAALSLHAGGVGYYPVNQFVHVDVGPERQWQYGGRRVSTKNVASTRPIHRRPHRVASAASGE